MSEEHDDDDGLTPAQKQARDKAWEILKEHFDSAVLIFDTEVKEGTDRAFQANFDGGITMAIGLCDRARMRFSQMAEMPQE